MKITVAIFCIIVFIILWHLPKQIQVAGFAKSLMRLCSIVIGVFLVLFYFKLFPDAEKVETKIFNSTRTANVRDVAGMEGSNIICRVKEGQKFKVLDKNGDWIKISTLEGKDGWVNTNMGQIEINEETLPPKTYSLRQKLSSLRTAFFVFIFYCILCLASSKIRNHMTVLYEHATFDENDIGDTRKMKWYIR